MKRIIRASLLVGVGLALLAPGRAVAQTCQSTGATGTCSVNVSTSLTLPVLPLTLTVGAASTPFGTVTSTDFDNGYARLVGPSVTVKANRAWTMGISSASTFWAAANTDPGTPARTTKPLADLQWGSALAGPYTSVSGTTTTFGSGTGTAGTLVPLYFQSLWNYSLDTPGNYSITVTFTMTAP